jgi:cell division protein FtsA
LRDLCQHVLDKQVRLGRPIRLSGLPDAVSGPAFATTAGLLAYISEHADEMPAEIMTHLDTGNIIDRVRRWWRENW